MNAEIRKLTTARALVALPVAAVLYAALSFGPAVALPAAERRAMEPDLLLSVVRGPGFTLAFLMLLLGALAAGGEFRHGTIVGTLLVRPRRGEVVRAKALAVAAVAAATAVAVEAVALGLGVAFARANGIGNDAAVADLAVSALGVVVVAVLYALAGTGLGLAVRDQTAAVGIALFWVGIVEGAVPVVLRKAWLFRWLPGGAANSVLGAGDPPPDLLPAWAGGLMLLAVAGALVAAGGAVLARRDV